MRLPEQVQIAGFEHTKDGPTGPAFVRPMAGQSDDWRLELLDGIGHLILDEAREQVERHARPVLAQ